MTQQTPTFYTTHALTHSVPGVGTPQRTTWRIKRQHIMLAFLYVASAHLYYGELDRGASARRFHVGGCS
ncbi:hypothetical protein [Vibrio quintilis]|uniref:hypothetical protein n=1 Tax=Vibrio quintilis TaxID=1117707 RepID=UPI001161063E|nr:hypothetical protein [Vibrio quintilis]